MEDDIKPELTAEEAVYLVNKTDEVHTKSHADRNNMGLVVTKLVAIINWHKEREPSE
jgi:hypothetical protein